VLERTGYSVHTRAAASTSVAFVSQVAIDDGLAGRVNIERPLVAIENCRGRTKKDLPGNSALPHIEVDPDTYAVRVDGQLIEHEPATELPMAQRYFLF
jgi:urease subunit alpha